MNCKKNQLWTELQWYGQRFYLPKYVKTFRKLENKIIKTIVALKFRECMFPKLLTYDQYSELINSFPRFSKEWSKEVMATNYKGAELNVPKKFTLSHWQCEPFYYFLRKMTPKLPLKYFDRSGWTYRIEKDINDYRLFEFQRIECVWIAPRVEAEQILETISVNLEKIFFDLGLQTRISIKKDEEKETGELLVKDIEVLVKDFGWVEIVGMHSHGRLFIEKLGIPIDDSYYTGCCGIGTSRLTNILLNARAHPGDSLTH